MFHHGTSDAGVYIMQVNHIIPPPLLRLIFFPRWRDEVLAHKDAFLRPFLM